MRKKRISCSTHPRIIAGKSHKLGLEAPRQLICEINLPKIIIPLDWGSVLLGGGCEWGGREVRGNPQANLNGTKRTEQMIGHLIRGGGSDVM